MIDNTLVDMATILAAMDGEDFNRLDGFVAEGYINEVRLLWNL